MERMMIKEEELTPEREVTKKKERQGRWSKAQKYLFDALLEKFGKNWVKIHEQMPQRSLSQIRSHAQKFFEKVGPAKVQEYKRTADLIAAYSILNRENVRQLESTSPGVNKAQMIKLEVDTSGDEEKSSECASDKSSSEGSIKTEDKKVLKNGSQAIKPIEAMNFMPMVGLANPNTPMGFLYQMGNNSLFVPYSIDNVMLNNLQVMNEIQ